MILSSLATMLFARVMAGHSPSKTDKKTAKYQDHPNKDQRCALCNYFRPPKSRQLVDGDISPNGWCSFFAKNRRAKPGHGLVHRPAAGGRAINTRGIGLSS
jgi:hypothetical protein